MQFKVWYIIFWVLFLTHQLIQHYFKINIPFVHAYLDDVLFFTIILPIFQFVHFKLTNKKQLENVFIAILCVFFSVLVEFIFPYFSTKHTTDYFDFIAYFIGIVIYKILLEKSLNHLT
jgi:hypothetical protein